MRPVGVISISNEEKSRFAISTAKQLNSSDKYVVELDVFHQLHCLVGTQT
jgi:hypothetical protein